jgi:hypothetical protein
MKKIRIRIRNIGFIAVPNLEKFPFQFLLRLPLPDPDSILHSFSTTQKFVHNLAFSMLEAALFPRKLASHFLFVFHFMLDPDPNPVTEPECVSVLVPLSRKAAVPVPVPQHCLH